MTVPQDRPDAPELLAAVARYLFEDLLPRVPDEERFRVRVAANACAMLAREWEAGPGRPDRTAQHDLATAIRAGAHDDRLAETAATLRDDVAARLAVSHPGWTDLADDGRG
ncbi:MAG: hypothetical protein QOE65_1087 [Solirubrobacteraceae bacterium]|jgi:hypothetical protein|nr:hypothetical protein [Solirubrobacteraceae bacterium]